MPTCPSNVTIWTDPVLTDIEFKRIHINELIANINRERTRRSLGAISIPPANYGDEVEAAKIIAIRDAINTTRAGLTWGVDLTIEAVAGLPNKGSHILELRKNLNIAEGECLCHCFGDCGCNGHCAHCGSFCDCCCKCNCEVGGGACGCWCYCTCNCDC